MDDLGCFWAINMLVIERLHVLLKRMASGARNKMQSFVNHYDLWDAAQTTWRWEGNWTINPKKSGLAGYKPMREYNMETEAKGAQRAGKLSHELFNQVLNLWATENRGFDRLLDRYRRAMSKRDRAGRRIAAVPLKLWTPSRNRDGLTAEETRWAATKRSVKVTHNFPHTFCPYSAHFFLCPFLTLIFYFVHHTFFHLTFSTMCLSQTMNKATLDGVLFRTKKAEARTRSCNSCVTERYMDRDNALEQKDIYGRVKTMFSHEFGGQTEIIVEVEWYDSIGVNPRTLLTQVNRNRNFDACRVSFLKNMYPYNLVMWPSDIANPANGLLDVIKHNT
jgi:hypothetical protein